uniref:Uncharacterized protein n=1 Tax=Anguilla anguilla TaxID=7936 RepID=A0A0E9QXW2_ANGAN
MKPRICLANSSLTT